jgi:hypothetical protein
MLALRCVQEHEGNLAVSEVIDSTLEFIASHPITVAQFHSDLVTAKQVPQPTIYESAVGAIRAKEVSTLLAHQLAEGRELKSDFWKFDLLRQTDLRE